MRIDDTDGRFVTGITLGPLAVSQDKVGRDGLRRMFSSLYEGIGDTFVQ
jgi:hypothetical protein